ncbi:hypothetical protein MRX96_036063 [Rhipicephalus microplus]
MSPPQDALALTSFTREGRARATVVGAAEDGVLVPEDNATHRQTKFGGSWYHRETSQKATGLCHGAVQVLRHNGRAGLDVDDQEDALTHWTCLLAGYFFVFNPLGREKKETEKAGPREKTQSSGPRKWVSERLG